MMTPALRPGGAIVPHYRLGAHLGLRTLTICGEYLSIFDHLSSPSAIRDLAFNFFCEQPFEVAAVFLLDTRNRPIGIVELSMGDSNGVEFSLEMAVTAAVLKVGTTAVVLAHNHLYESADPSQSDLEMIEGMRQCWPRYVAALHDIIICAPPACLYSAREAGRLGSTMSTDIPIRAAG